MQSDQRLWSVGYFFAGAPLAKHHSSEVRNRRPNIARAMRHIQRGVQRIKAMFCNANPKRKIAASQSPGSASRHSPETGDRNDSLCAMHILGCLCCAGEPSWSSLFNMQLANLFPTAIFASRVLPLGLKSTHGQVCT